MRVITSYSIHYTKLYDGQQQVGGGVGRGARCRSRRIVEGAERGARRTGPRAVGLALEREADQGVAGLADADVGGRLAGGRAVGGYEAAFVAQEFDDGAAGVDECEAVGGAVLV